MFRMREKDIPVQHDDGRLSYVREQVFYPEDQNPKFVYSDVPYNQGPPMSDCTTILAKDLHRKFGYEPEELSFYERLEDGRYHKPDFKMVGGEIRKYDTRNFYTKEELTAWLTKDILYSPDDYKQHQHVGKLQEKDTATAWQGFTGGVSAPKLSLEEALRLHSETEEPKRRR